MHLKCRFDNIGRFLQVGIISEILWFTVTFTRVFKHHACTAETINHLPCHRIKHKL